MSHPFSTPDHVIKTKILHLRKLDNLSLMQQRDKIADKLRSRGYVVDVIGRSVYVNNHKSIQGYMTPELALLALIPHANDENPDVLADQVININVVYAIPRVNTNATSENETK